MKHTGTKALSWLLCLALVLGLLPGMGLTVRAATATYTALMNNATVVKFNGYDWYIIEDNSTSDGKGTVTLLAADNKFGLSKFSDSDSTAYSSSKIKVALDEMTVEGGAFADVANAIAGTDLEDVSVTGAKLYLLSTEEAKSLPENVRKAEFTGGNCSDNEWWLRSAGKYNKTAACVFGKSGNVIADGSLVSYTLGVRPALKLNLESVIFSSESKTFTVGSASSYSVTYNTNGGSAVDPATGVSVLPDPLPTTTKDGYVFDGWYMDETLTTEATAGSEITADTTLYAKWKSREVTAAGVICEMYAFNELSSSGAPGFNAITEEQAKAFVGAVESPTDRFIVVYGYEEASDAYVATDEGGQSLIKIKWSVVFGDYESYFKGRTFYFAKSAPTVRSVTLNANEGTVNSGNITKYTEGTGATLPTDVTRDGYIFGGWYDNEGLTGSSVSVISETDTGNREYWAKWFESLVGKTYPVDGTGNLVIERATWFADGRGGTATVPSGTYAISFDNLTDSPCLYKLSGNKIYITNDTTKRIKALTIVEGTGLPGNPYVFAFLYDNPISNTVIFSVVNGLWDDGTTADKTVTLTGYEGDTLKLTAGQIPAVGTKPNDTYKAGSWDTEPNTKTAIIGATTYTYTYAAKEAAVVTKAPEAKTLTYTGSAQELVTAGTATGGEMQYALGTATEATEPYTTSIPTATDAGTYYVWYKVVGDANHNDSAAACVTVTISAPYVPPYSGDSGNDSTPATTTVTVPVSGDDETVNVTVRVSGDTATVTGANVDKVLEAETVGTVTIDVSSLKQNVTEVSIPGTMVKKIADAVADESNNADGLEIKLPTGTVTFDGSAVAAISEQANGKDLRLNLEDIGENKLNTAQKDTVRDMDVQEVLDAYMTAGGQRIFDFKGGKATVTVPYELKAEQRAAGVTVWYVADNGDKTEMPSTYDGKDVKFTVEHFSNYVIAYDAERAAACPRDETCPVSAFTDTDPGAWYHDGVHYALEKGLMNGVGDNRFDPNGTAGRGMIVTILYRMENEPEVAAENPFGDVVDGQWYTNAVIWAAENKIVDGYGGGKFGPNDHITREQLVTILYRYAKWKGVDVSVGEDTNILSYDDAFDVSEWAIPAMQWAVGSGAVGGRTNTTLNPKDTATRAEAATIIMRYCTEIAK